MHPFPGGLGRVRTGVVLRTAGLVVAGLLGVLAVWMIVTGDTQKRVQLGVVLGAWGLLLAAISVFGARRHEATEAGGELMIRSMTGLDRLSDAAAVREYEQRLQALIRHEIHQALGAELASLRSEVAAMRSELDDKVGGQLRLERIETTRLIGSDLEALQQEVQQLKIARQERLEEFTRMSQAMLDAADRPRPQPPPHAEGSVAAVIDVAEVVEAEPVAPAPTVASQPSVPAPTPEPKTEPKTEPQPDPGSQQKAESPLQPKQPQPKQPEQVQPAPTQPEPKQPEQAQPEHPVASPSPSYVSVDELLDGAPTGAAADTPAAPAAAAQSGAPASPPPHQPTQPPYVQTPPPPPPPYVRPAPTPSPEPAQSSEPETTTSPLPTAPAVAAAAKQDTPPAPVAAFGVGNDPFASLPRIRPFTEFDLDPIDPIEPAPANDYAGRRRSADEMQARQSDSEPDSAAAPQPPSGGRRRREADDEGDDLLARILQRESHQ